MLPKNKEAPVADRKIGITMPALLLSCLLGMAVSLLLCQLLWAESGKSRGLSFAHTVLRHAESVAANVSEAVAALDRSTLADCSDADLVAMKRLMFEYRFIKDAGRFDADGKIICSAVWNALQPAVDIGAPTLSTRNRMRLWTGTRSFSTPERRIDIAGTRRSFVVTSPSAFAPFENGPPELAALVTSSDGSVIMRRFGQVEQGGDRLSRREARNCSQRFDICVTAQIDSDIFTSAHSGMLSLTVALGAALGAVAWLALASLFRRNRTLASRLAVAIESDQIRLLYQPIIRASSGQLAGFEALARWRDKGLGDIGPDIFISKAAELGMSPALNRSIVRRALRECGARLNRDPHIYLSINLDIDALLDQRMVELLLDEARQHGIAPRQIAIEILEGSTTDLSLMQAGIEEVRQLGFKVFIDDFGTGYSSLAYLGRLNVDKIKIDRIFTQMAGTESAAAMILQKIFEVAKDVDTGVIFEGVETAAQMRAILAFCPDALAQGWLYSKAVPVAEIAASYQPSTDA